MALIFLGLLDPAMGSVAGDGPLKTVGAGTKGLAE